jgi:hypothetical protein
MAFHRKQLHLNSSTSWCCAMEWRTIHCGRLIEVLYGPMKDERKETIPCHLWGGTSSGRIEFKR